MRSKRSLHESTCIPPGCGGALATSRPAAWADFASGQRAYNQGDFRAAMEQWRPLAEQGDAKAQFSLGKMYVRAQGVGKDYKRAAFWYRQAAGQGHGLSQVALAAMYAMGNGMDQDYVQAYKWYLIAEAGGQKQVKVFRQMIANEMTPAQIAEAEKLAAGFKPAKHQ